jgi:MoaA/NifB/PqqE/SkfB family radical SAM enzyme
VLPPRAYALVVIIVLSLNLRIKRTLFTKYKYPSTLAIFLTTRCNLRCFICRREDYKGEDLTFENIYKLEKAIRYANTIDLTGWGECFLYPRFEDVLRYIYSINARDNLIQIATNGTRLSQHISELLRGHMKLVLISLNAATAETYNRDMKHGNFTDTVSAIQSFMSGLNERDKGKVQLHFVAHTNNIHEIPDFVRLARKLGITKVSFGNYLVGIPEHYQYSLIHVKEQYNHMIDEAMSLGVKLGVQVMARKFFVEKECDYNYQKCQSPFTECFVGPNGNVSPCCYSGTFSMGNAYETDFASVWFGELYLKLRRRRFLAACQRCIPFLPLDDYRVHFTEPFKQSDTFKHLEQSMQKGKDSFAHV